MMDSISFGIDVSSVRRENAAAPDHFFETAAIPDSLSAIMRGAIIVRELSEPIGFPFYPHQIVGFED